MDEPVYVWELTIPQKIEYKLWQALLLLGIDIHDEYTVWFSDYMWLHKACYTGCYSDIIMAVTDQEMIAIWHKLKDLKAYGTDMWIVDELCDDEEEE